MNQKDRIKELVETLNAAAKAYYTQGRELMSNMEYDQLYDELLALEAETGMVLSASPTQNVGYEPARELPKREHEFPMLSLDKTKEVADLIAWTKGQKSLLSWKMDGLTIVLTYREGMLDQAVTRGNGYIGELVTNNVKNFVNVPVKIPYQEELVLRGEAVIRYSDFRKINETLKEGEALYKNPRNLCSGSVRQLNPAITKERQVYWYAFGLVSAPGVDFHNSRKAQFEWLQAQGFDTVEYVLTDENRLAADVADFEGRIASNDVPSDGLVLLMDDIAYGESLGQTAKFPRNAIAFKWRDETQTTVLTAIEWSPSRTGLINPVALFDPVELEGTTVSRASVHNVSIVKSLELGLGDKIVVYKANMIIPQIAENLTKSGGLHPPKHCPSCQGETILKKENEVEVLLCPNPDCPVKHIKQYALMASRDALNIEGLSEATLEKFLSHGFMEEAADLFTLERHREEIVSLEGFGERSFEKLLAAIEAARHTTMARFLYALGIPGIGSANAKVIARYFEGDLTKLQTADLEELTQIEGIGEVLAAGIRDFFAQKKNRESISHLLKFLSWNREEAPGEGKMKGLTFVITGSLNHYSNREALKEYIESQGGKVAGSVSKKTSYLINNDTASASSKNKKARELGIEILSEEDFNRMFVQLGENHAN